MATLFTFGEAIKGIVSAECSTLGSYTKGFGFRSSAQSLPTNAVMGTPNGQPTPGVGNGGNELEP